jgi:hypothetical protein
MLRLIALLLLLANGLYYAWAEGVFAGWGLGPASQREPQRLNQQIRPQDIRVLPPEEARLLQPVVHAARPPECLQAGPLPEAATATLRQALAAWPNGSWTLEPMTEPARWVVYMGKYPDPQSVERKKGELRQIGVAYEPLANPELEPGLSLGGHLTEESAQQQLERLATRGVRTARVVLERAELRGQRLTLAAVDDTLRVRLDELRSALDGKTLRPCR